MLTVDREAYCVPNSFWDVPRDSTQRIGNQLQYKSSHVMTKQETKRKTCDISVMRNQMNNNLNMEYLTRTKIENIEMHL